MDHILSEKELAIAMNLSIWTVRRLRLSAGMPHLVFGSRIYYNIESVRKWLADKERSGGGVAVESVEIGTIREIK